jgi:phage terminase large subunit-like protein
VHERALEHPRRWIALVARTPADARDYMIEGPGGILRNSPPQERPNYEPSKRRLTWPNGSWATIYSDEEPDQTRGFSGDTAWLDEFAKFVNPEDTWTNLSFGMRESSNDKPRRLITTTPRPLAILTQIKAMESTVVVTGSSYENADNLDPAWFSDVLAHYEGTRLGRQEINAEILEDVVGALWTRAMLDRARFNCGPVDEIRRGDAPVSSEQQLSLVGVWAG